MRNNPIAFRPTDENKKYLATILKGGKSLEINGALDKLRESVQPKFTKQEMSKAKRQSRNLCVSLGVPLTHPRQVKK